MKTLVNKVAKALIAVVMAFGTSGCVRNIVRKPQATYVPNANRSTNHKYDFIDYLTITTWGADGDGYISVTPRDISASDFSDEQSYIDVTEDLKTLGIVYGQDVGTYVTLSQSSGLSNGDVVTISVGSSGNKLRTDMNTEPYEYTVAGLGDAESVDLFSSDIVTIYGTRENDLFAYIHTDNTAIPAELTKHLVYTLETDSESLTVGKTIVNATASLDDDFMQNNGYSSLTDYLAKHNLQGDVSKEVVLRTIVDPIDFTTIDAGTLMSALYDKISASDTNLSRVCSVQRRASETNNDSSYAYMITYFDMVDNSPVYYRARAVVHDIDGTFVVQSMDSAQNASRDVMISPVQGYEVCVTFVSDADFNAAAPSVETPEPTPETTATPTPEATVTATAAPTSAPASSNTAPTTVTQPSSGGSSSSSSSGTTKEYYSDDPADYPAGTVFTYDENGNLTGVYVPDENGDVLLPDKS